MERSALHSAGIAELSAVDLKVDAERPPWPKALARSPADLPAAITGVAGPSRDEDDNPVGLVCIAVARRGHSTATLEKRYGDIGREAVREAAIAGALPALRQAAER